MEVKSDPSAGVALLVKAFTVLDMFQVDRPTWSQAELVRATKLNRSTVNRLVRFLASTGYLTQIASTGRYSLGLASIELGIRASDGFELKSVSQKEMARLADAIQETVLLSAYDASRSVAVCIDQIVGKNEGLRVYERIGSTFPLHAGAAPKVILAYLPEVEQSKYLSGELQRFTNKTIIDVDDINKQLKEARTLGYCISWEETFVGTVGYAAPILGVNGAVIGSFGVSLPISSATTKISNNIITQLVSSASTVTKLLHGSIGSDI
ncbi:IclR family transcriptional regulator [Lentilitoribacter sp. Alg239-R112]|uniref:IclR family transcriptional regulator n=1 Tax=Lentilitoribacter sp. Alg239-R112 TaxID=2305987 RepID=UPI0013A6D0C1|nr:IclR family transcriptional regulator [Lentilitoribacter sp. Alg239-R112]